MMGLSDYHTHASQVNFEASSVSVSEPLPLSLSRYLFMSPNQHWLFNFSIDDVRF